MIDIVHVMVPNIEDDKGTVSFDYYYYKNRMYQQGLSGGFLNSFQNSCLVLLFAHIVSELAGSSVVAWTRR